MLKLKYITIVLVSMAAFTAAGPAAADKTPPHYDAVMEIIRPLEYTGFPVLAKPGTGMDIDFGKRMWTLRNIRSYDPQGVMLLEEGRYGLCAELSTYVYEKIKPVFDDRYEIKFGIVTEPDFFPDDASSHVVLLMLDTATRQSYLIDPSFHKYGKLGDFTDYRIWGAKDVLAFDRDKSRDMTFQADRAMPLLIKDDLLVSFAVTSVDGKFDRGNFLFVIAVNRRSSRGPGLDIVMVGRHDGEEVAFENKDMLAQVLNPQEIDRMYNKFKDWLKET